MAFPLALHSRLLLTLRTRALPRFLCSSHSHHVSHARMLVAPAIPILLIRLALMLLGLVRLLLTLRLSILLMAGAKRICRVCLLSRSVTPMSSFQAVEQSGTIQQNCHTFSFLFFGFQIWGMERWVGSSQLLTDNRCCIRMAKFLHSGSANGFHNIETGGYIMK